jgi:hypothetical protein
MEGSFPADCLQMAPFPHKVPQVATVESRRISGAKLALKWCPEGAEEGLKQRVPEVGFAESCGQCFRPVLNCVSGCYPKPVGHPHLCDLGQPTVSQYPVLRPSIWKGSRPPRSGGLKILVYERERERERERMTKGERIIFRSEAPLGKCVFRHIGLWFEPKLLCLLQ